jgi:hypothetical protein
MAEFRFIFLAISLVIVGSIASVKLRENYADQKINQEIKQNYAAQENRAAH